MVCELYLNQNLFLKKTCHGDTMINQNIGLDMYSKLKKHLSSSQSTNIRVLKTEGKGQNGRSHRRGGI